MARPKYQIVWSSDADSDLLEIWGYLARYASQVVADRTTRGIRRSCDRLIRLPLLGRPRGGVLPGIRSLLVNPYVVFYRLHNNEVEIVRVLHGRRDIDTLFAEGEDS
jgi:toxin ParE1/3/4